MRRAIAMLSISVCAACGGDPPGAPISLEVVAPRTILAGKDLSLQIDDEMLAAIRARREVLAVMPRVELRPAAYAVVALGGHERTFPLVGVVDGFPVSAVADDPELAARFVELDEAAAGASCANDPCADPAGQYCDVRDLRCRPRVPVIVSPEVIALYNERIAPADGLPLIGEMETFLAVKRRLVTFTLRIGEREVGALLVGVSPRARLLGASVPIGHVLAWNREDGGASPTYSSLEVTLRDRRQLAGFTRWLEREQRLEAHARP